MKVETEAPGRAEAFVHFGPDGQVQEVMVDLRKDLDGSLRARILKLLNDGIAR